MLSDLLVRGPEHVGSAIVGDRDAVVGADRDPAAENVEVSGGHLALLTGGTARAAVVDALARCDDRALAPAS